MPRWQPRDAGTAIQAFSIDSIASRHGAALTGRSAGGHGGRFAINAGCPHDGKASGTKHVFPADPRAEHGSRRLYAVANDTDPLLSMYAHDAADDPCVPLAEVLPAVSTVLRGRVSVAAEIPVRSVSYPACCGQNRSSIRLRRFAVLIGRFCGSGT